MPESLHDKTMREHGERYAAQKATEKNFAGYTGYTTKGSFWKEQKKDLQDKLRCLGGCVGTIISIAVVFCALWLLVAAIKWMWEHS